MILTCPACASRYVVDDTSVGAGGRMVRCSHCKTAWRAEPGEGPLELAPARESVETLTTPAAPADLPGEALPKQFRARVQQQERVRKVAAAGAVWGGMAVLLASLLGLAVLFRTEIARAWPKTASAYAAMGLRVNVLGLTIDNVTSAPGIENGREVLVVAGDVRNVSDEPRPLPAALRLELVGKDDAVLATGRVALKSELIPVEQARPFTFRFFDPPEGATVIRSAFVTSREESAEARPAPKSAAPAPHG
jgi:predicted Zn finger-like uncharacterized protein